MKETIQKILLIIMCLIIVLTPKITNAAITDDEMVNEDISIKEENKFFNYIKDEQYLIKDENDNGNIVLHLAEKNEISNETYETVINAINVLLGKNATGYFKEMCPNLNQDIKIDGFTVEINPERTKIEKGIFNNENFYQYKCLVRVTIDTNKVNDVVNKYVSNNGSTNADINNTKGVLNVSEMPKTGEEKEQILIIPSILIVLSIIGIFSLILTGKNK